jgi:hypothetical protein
MPNKINPVKLNNGDLDEGYVEVKKLEHIVKECHNCHPIVVKFLTIFRLLLNTTSVLIYSPPCWSKETHTWKNLNKLAFDLDICIGIIERQIETEWNGCVHTNYTKKMRSMEQLFIVENFLSDIYSFMGYKIPWKWSRPTCNFPQSALAFLRNCHPKPKQKPQKPQKEGNKEVFLMLKNEMNKKEKKSEEEENN